MAYIKIDRTYSECAQHLQHELADSRNNLQTNNLLPLSFCNIAIRIFKRIRFCQQSILRTSRNRPFSLCTLCSRTSRRGLAFISDVYLGIVLILQSLRPS